MARARVAPSQERELKSSRRGLSRPNASVAPSQERELKFRDVRDVLRRVGRSFTGA